MIVKHDRNFDIQDFIEILIWLAYLFLILWIIYFIDYYNVFTEFIF